MTVVLRHNPTLELNRADYSGSVTLAELVALADFQAAHPDWLAYDCLNLIAAETNFASVDLSALDEVFQKYRALFEPLHFVIFRRSAWVCQSEAARGHLRYWIVDRDTRADMSSDLREFESIADGCQWLLLSSEQTGMAISGEGFDEIARFDLPLAPVRAAAR